MNQTIIKTLRKSVAPVVLFAIVLFAVVLADGQKRAKQDSENGGERTILVTASTHDEKSRDVADKLRPSDFSVRENKVTQKIVSVREAPAEPIVLAVLIQDDLVSRVNNELDEIRKFIRSLPLQSRVMVGYLTVGSMQVRQAFTDDKERAAGSLRIVTGSPTAAPYNPYVQTIDALKLFNGEKRGRRMILLVSDGLDASAGFRFASPFMSVDLDRAIREAQRREVTVYSMFAPSAGLTQRSRIAANYGQGSLNRLSSETGGEAFFSGMDFVTFDPYFREFNQLLKRQWLVTYRSSIAGKGFRRIQVSTDFDIHLNHPAGYEVR